MMRPAAIYARVSSDRQKEDHTIASQTQAVMDYATAHGYLVPQDWIFEDEGVSGAVLVRPALEAVRDLAAQGQIEAVLVHSPDRLSRKYAYQVLLIEEFARQGVETTFVKAPRAETPEDQLVVQFQGMIAEYERAQIAERSRRGKRHHARAGSVNVLSGAPYGYRYVRKTEAAGAYYEIIEAEAGVVRLIYEAYTTQGLSINAIARLLNVREIRTRKRISQWERSTVWAILRNPAYKGLACYGKTEARPRQRITRPLRRRGGFAARDSANHERPREDWIEIPVPPLVSAESFDLAQELLVRNKRIRDGAPSSRACCRACWCARAAVMRCIGPRPGPANGGFITIAAWVPTPIDIPRVRAATIGRSDKITSTAWFGRRSSVCSRPRP